MKKENGEVKDLVVLVLAGESKDPAKVPVPLILSAGVIELHLGRTLEDARRNFKDEGYVLAPNKEITFPTTLPLSVRPQGATRLEVWVKYSD